MRARQKFGTDQERRATSLEGAKEEKEGGIHAKEGARGRATLVTKGDELLQALERHGPSFIPRLVIADILDLSHDPR